MSKAYQCDRCGEYTEGRGSRLIQSETGTAGINDAVESADMDLCYGCTAELKKWWNQ